MQDVPKIVVRRLHGMAVANWHPEPDLLTAFSEQSLGHSERAFVLDHLAGCSECRQILELAMPVAERETVTGIASAWPVWLSRPLVGWGFATAAILALIFVSVLRYEHKRSEAELASSPSPAAQIVSGKSFAANREPSESPAQSQEPAVQEPRSAAAKQPTMAHMQAVPAKSDFQKTKGFGSNGEMKSEAEAVARTQTSDQLVQNQAVSQYQPYTSSDVVKAKAAVSSQNSGDSAPAMAAPNVPSQAAQSLLLPASPRWTVNAAGGLQRSFDAGKTWEDVTVTTGPGQPQSKVIFRAVAVIGPEVWAGGTGTMLYHSSDFGTRWQQIFPSSLAAQPVGDIIEIEFSSPQQGRIATSAGEIWTTSDSGQTWRKQP
jgi:Photosynthesis system II assembly factor YCF48